MKKSKKKIRNPYLVPAKSRKAGTMKDKRKKRKKKIEDILQDY